MHFNFQFCWSVWIFKNYCLIIYIKRLYFLPLKYTKLYILAENLLIFTNFLFYLHFSFSQLENHCQNLKNVKVLIIKHGDITKIKVIE